MNVWRPICSLLIVVAVAACAVAAQYTAGAALNKKQDPRDDYPRLCSVDFALLAQQDRRIFSFPFIVLFVVQFFVPAFRLKRKLNRVISRLKAVKEANEAGVVDLEAIAGQAMAVGNLQHLWSAYAVLLPAR